MTLQVFTANRLIDGVVVYLTEDGHWSPSVFLSSVISNDDGLELMALMAEAGVGQSIILNPYLIEVTRDDGKLRPTSYRERLRAFGPSSHPQFSKLSAAA